MSSVASTSERRDRPHGSIPDNVYINMQDMKYDEDSFLDVKRYMPEVETLQAGGKIPVPDPLVKTLS